MLSSVLDFMRISGISDQMIHESFKICMAQPKRNPAGFSRPRRDGLRIGNENLIADLLRLWHRDDRYIDADANPQPLSLDKGRKSLRAMIRRLDPAADVAEILHEMKAVRLLRKQSSGKYLPTSDSAIVGKLHPLAIDHIAKLVIRLVSTVMRNVNSADSTLRLIERHAYAPDLDAAEGRAFAEFTRSQGMAYLESVDNWLEKRRVRRTLPSLRRNSTGIAASVHLFAYLADGEVGGMAEQQRVASHSRAERVLYAKKKSPKKSSKSPAATLS